MTKRYTKPKPSLAVTATPLLSRIARLIALDLLRNGDGRPKSNAKPPTPTTRKQRRG